MTEISREKIRISHKGKPNLNKGKKLPPLSEATKLKISLANKGRRYSDISIKKMSERAKGNKHCLGVKRSDKTKQKMSLAKSGINHPNWQGGKSKELYGFDWTNLLRHSIRTRDCFVCQICKKNGWIVHHIDYNKKNCNSGNLITLCNFCHAKTNGNREYWERYFINLINPQTGLNQIYEKRI